MDLFDAPLEQAVIGALIVNSALVDKLASVIKPKDLYDPLHQRIFSVMQEMYGSGEQLSPLTISLAMKDDPGLIEVGGTSYLANVALASPSLPNIRQLGKSIKELSDKRALVKIAEDIASSVQEGKVSENITRAEQALYGLAEKGSFGTRMVSFSGAIKLAISQAEKAQDGGGKITGLPTGFKEVDAILGGLQNSDFIIIAGRPGMGKTALATNMAFHAASQGKPILFFSLEMAAQQLSARILSEQSGVEMWRVRNGQMRPQEWEDYVLTGQKLDSLPLHIDDSGGIPLPHLAARARRAKRELGIAGIIIDYIQLMGGDRRENRTQEVTEITKGLKALAKELDVPIIALSQLSRGVEARDDKRPMLSDLRESGSIEQDADIVMFVYRSSYYLKGREPDIGDPKYSDWQKRMEQSHGLADVIIEKHRHGSTGTVKLGFDAEFTRFKDLDGQ